MRFRMALVLGSAALLSWSGPAFAWGPFGHAVVARIAARELTPAARREVERLIGRPADWHMAAVSSWPDWQGREHPETKPWHYVDIEIGERGYVAARDCPTGQCVVAAIARFEAVLRNRHAPDEDRAEALIWLIHLIGDLHQPLHCADDHDRGGNAVRLWNGDHRTNLHSIWDRAPEALPGAEGGAEAVARVLERDIGPLQPGDWKRGTPARWATQSFRIARDRIYQNVLATKEKVSVRPNPTIVRIQLEKAGVRLGALINQNLE